MAPIRTSTNTPLLASPLLALRRDLELWESWVLGCRVHRSPKRSLSHRTLRSPETIHILSSFSCLPYFFSHTFRSMCSVKNSTRTAL
ncbi:hypothetical protein VTO42DRAFT_1242 [Malbranchea cinnamomea]